MVAVSDNEMRPVRIVPRAILAALAIAFVILASYYTLELWAAGPDLRQGERIFQSPDELAKLQDDERLLLIAREREALLSDPLDSRSLKSLAMLAKANGKQKQADELILLAANRSLRDLTAGAEALAILLARKDFIGVLYRLDGLIRSKPERMPELLPIALAFAEARESRSALVAVLVQNPPWRVQLVTHIAEKATKPAIAYRLLTDLRKTAAPPTRDEVRRLLARLVKDHDYETAYFVWLDFLTDVELTKVAQIFDGGFDLEPNNMFFDWTYGSLMNTDLRIVPRAISSADRVLQIDFAHSRDHFANLSQLMRVVPGSYRFSGETKTGNLRIEAGFVWRFYCISDGSERLLTETPRIPQSDTWMRFESKVEVPPEDCSTQLLRLELDARASLDQRVAGRISFDNLRLTPSTVHSTE